MASMMTLAFQMFGRLQDELIHIMAPDDKMDPTNPESKSWFFPRKPGDPSEKLDVNGHTLLRQKVDISGNLDVSGKVILHNQDSSGFGIFLGFIDNTTNTYDSPLIPVTSTLDTDTSFIDLFEIQSFEK